MALTSLAIAQYDVHASSACPEHDHADIIAAIEAGDVRRAERLMLDHLDHVEQGLQPPAAEPAEIDFAQIFQVDPDLQARKTRAPPRRRKA